MYEAFKTIENNRRKYIITCIEKIKVERQAELEDIMSMYKRYCERIEEMNKIEEQKNIDVEEAKEDTSKIKKEPVENTTLIETNGTPIIDLKRNETKIETDSETKYKTNIPYSQSLITKYISSQCLESKDKIDNNVRGLINKRITQISKDADHISEIAKELKKYTQNKQCIIQINKKIIEQGKLQVSIYKESYKSYSYFLSQIYNAELLADLRARILTTEMNENRHFTGVYLIYFGFLKLEKMFEEAWFVLASMLNVEPSGGSLYVLEAFILVLGCNMYNFYGSEFSKIRDYLQLEHFSNVDNDPVKSRIGSLIENIMK